MQSAEVQTRLLLAITLYFYCEKSEILIIVILKFMQDFQIPIGSNFINCVLVSKIIHYIIIIESNIFKKIFLNIF